MPSSIQDSLPADLVVVDLANMRVGPRRRKSIFGYDKEAFVAENVWRFMAFLDALQLHVPIIYILDAGVKFENPSPRDNQALAHFEQLDPLNQRKVFRTVHSLKADDVIFDLHSAIRTVVISRDKFNKVEDSGLTDRERLLRFAPHWSYDTRRFSLTNNCPSEINHLHISQICHGSSADPAQTRKRATELIQQRLDVAVRSRRDRRYDRQTRRIGPLSSTIGELSNVFATLPSIIGIGETGTEVSLSSNSQSLRKERDEVIARKGLHEADTPRVLLFLWNARVRNLNSRVTAVGRWSKSDTGESPFVLKWFASTDPVEVRVSLPNLEFDPGQFVEVEGVLRRNSRGTWYIEEVSQISSIQKSSQLLAHPHGTKRQHRFLTWAMPPQHINRVGSPSHSEVGPESTTGLTQVQPLIEKTPSQTPRVAHDSEVQIGAPRHIAPETEFAVATDEQSLQHSSFTEPPITNEQSKQSFTSVAEEAADSLQSVQATSATDSTKLSKVRKSRGPILIGIVTVVVLSVALLTQLFV